MTIGQLKKSLSRFDEKLNDAEVVFTFNVDGKDKFEELAFVAYSEIPKEKRLVCILGTMSAAIERMKKGNLKYPDGHQPSQEGINLSNDTSDGLTI